MPHFSTNSPDRESLHDDLYYRLSIVLRLSQVSAEHGSSVASLLKRQLNAIRSQLTSDPRVAVALAFAAGDVARAISAMENGAKLTKWAQNSTAVLELLPEDGTTLLRSRLEVVRQFVTNVRELNETLAKKAISRTEFTQWWLQTIRRTELTVWRAVSAIFAEVEAWPRVAQGIDPDAFVAQTALLTAARGDAAQRTPGSQPAERFYEEALRLDPKCLFAMEGMAFLHERRGDHHAAWQWFRKALDSGSVRPPVLNSYAWIAASQPQLAVFDRRAVWAAERAVSAMPIAEFWDTLAEVRERQGDLDGALEAARESLRDHADRAEYQRRFQRLSDLIECAGRSSPGALHQSESPSDDSESVFGDADGDVTRNVGDSGINLLSTQDSGLLLDDLDLSGAGGLSSPMGDESDMRADDDFLLTPLPEGNDDSTEDGSQVIALDADFDDAAATLFAGDVPNLSEVFGSANCEPTLANDFGDSASPKPGWIARMRQKFGRAPSAVGHALRRGDFSPNPALPVDDVDCTVFATPEARPGDTVLVQVFAHLPEESAAATSLAKEFDRDAIRRGCESLGTKIARGSQLHFELTVADLQIRHAKDLTWKGRPASIQFSVAVAKSFAPRNITAQIAVLQNSVPIGEIVFKLSVVAQGARRTNPEPVESRARRIERAFASYASPDRDEVCKRVQMARAAGIQCFQDVLDLDPGERWERRLYQYIDQSDALFLFWSHHSRDSEWVTREWRYALKQKGLDFIRPVILEGPPIVPPPPELQALHFNDRMLYVMNGR